MPLRWEFLTQVEQPQQRRDAVRSEVIAEILDGAVLERSGIFSGCVLDVHDGVGNGAIVELAQRSAKVRHRRVGVVSGQVVEQLQGPFTDDARAFKRKIAVVAEGQLEHAAVVLSGAGSYRLNRNIV